MAKLYLVRHGRAAAGWDTDPDPGLDPTGQQQAQQLAAALAARGPLDLLTSPMARARETAAPLATQWGREPRIDSRVSEIPSPGLALGERGAWLREIAARDWHELDPTLHSWRTGILDALLGLERDSVIFTHFMVINAAAGVACGQQRLVWSRPDYCSVTVLSNTDGRLALLEQGAEAATRVL